MKILDYRPSKETAFLLHAVFFNFYCLLAGRTVLVFSGIQVDAQDISPWQRRLVALERLTDIIFFSVGLESSSTVYHTGSFYVEEYAISLLCAFTAFLTIHRGMFMNDSPKLEATWADKILKICRAIFFMLGSLLLILMLIRMGFALYDQIRPNKFERIFAVPSDK